MSAQSSIKIGIFYDGNYFIEVGKYYRYHHMRKKWISMAGLHTFVRKEIARHMQTEDRFCKIIDARFFRGRYYAKDCDDVQLRRDRIFDDSLMQQSVISHYAPLRRVGDLRQEKGIDVWLALEVFELTLHKQFQVVVLVASDGDYVPLLRKLNALGTEVILLAWEFSYVFGQNEYERHKETRVSNRLIEEAAHTIMMHEKIDSTSSKDEAVVDSLFYEPLKCEESTEPCAKESTLEEIGGQTQEGRILSLHNGYGFVKHSPNNLFFYHDDVENVDFNELKAGDKISYVQSVGEEGKEVALRIRKAHK